MLGASSAPGIFHAAAPMRVWSAPITASLQASVLWHTQRPSNPSPHFSRPPGRFEPQIELVMMRRREPSGDHPSSVLHLPRLGRGPERA
jgi:hypothetical protein